MKYYDKTQFGRDRTPGDPQRFHNVNSSVWRCGAAGVRALPVLTADDFVGLQADRPEKSGGESSARTTNREI